MSNRRPKQPPATVRLEALKSDGATVTNAAKQPGGVRVVDARGTEVFRLSIPTTPLPE
jgi:hypothetical protein